MPAKPSTDAEMATIALRRARMLGACVSLAAWPEALLMPAFVDGLCGLAAACDDLEIGDVALAAAAADESPGLSRIGRTLLAERAMRQTIDVGAASPARGARPGRSACVTAPIDLTDFGRVFGADAAALRSCFAPEPNVPADDEPRLGAPWAWPGAEPLRPVIAPAMTFSASRLNAFVKCPRRWYYEYLCDAVVEESTVHATYGKVFHEALEALHRDVRVPSNFSEEAILDRLRHELDAAFGKAHADFASVLEYEVCRLKARGVATQYVQWLCREAAARPLEVRDVEIAQRWAHGGYVFVGYIDRIDRPAGGGPITIYDYKTGYIPDDPAEYLDRVRAGEESQLALYWAMRRAEGDVISRIALISVRHPRDAAWMLALDILDDDAAANEAAADAPHEAGIVRAACNPADLDHAIGVLVERCNLLCERGVERFAAGDDPPCSFCGYNRACRERPEEEERIFAR
jgi:RecB family exonuclease